MVMESSSTVLVYRVACVAELKENQLITVKPTSTSAGGVADVDARRSLYAEPLGGSTSHYGVASRAPESGRTGAFVVGGIALVGLDAALTSSSDDSDSIIIGAGSGDVRSPISAE